MNRRWMATALGLLLALALFWVLRPQPVDPAQQAAVPQGAVAGVKPSSLAGDGPRAPVDSKASARPEPSLAPRAATRETLARAIVAARSRRLESGAQPPAPPVRDSPPAATKLDIANKVGSEQDWERRQLDVLRELLGECYDLAAAEQPELAGNIGIQFTMHGEPEVGGLVDEVSIMESYSTIADPNMRECMTQSIYSLELDPPPEGVHVGREITLRFEGE